jgi:hypothetical protein
MRLRLNACKFQKQWQQTQHSLNTYNLVLIFDKIGELFMVKLTLFDTDSQTEQHICRAFTVGLIVLIVKI